MADPSHDAIPPGTLDMLILRTLAHQEELHGFEIAEAIQRTSADVLRVEEGSLYPALQRMLVKGWISGIWGKTPENRRARYYRLTAAGKKQLAREIGQLSPRHRWPSSGSSIRNRRSEAGRMVASPALTVNARPRHRRAGRRDAAAPRAAGRATARCWR